jgi:hypothetical protein
MIKTAMSRPFLAYRSVHSLHLSVEKDLRNDSEDLISSDCFPIDRLPNVPRFQSNSQSCNPSPQDEGLFDVGGSSP